ncbi:MAG: sigma-70 family RNA polymerase sigma factor [Eubacteriales bacterium]|jgi:RNA polymerase sporulation-specific sigma factor|nr:sigma-70 family RNA polymerase sigma factor [Eubacteriales bacterium]MDY2983485.1 sigma-70 family RNA polymerase sigma factor [Eubacteriales bacterium]
MEDFCARIRAMHRGDTEQEAALLQENLPLAYAIARRYRNSGIEEEDLRQLASLGLLKALRRFDPDRGLCFSTYAVPVIAGEIKRCLRDDGPVHFSREIKALANQIDRLRHQGDMPLEELAQALNAAPEDVAAALMSREGPLSLNAPVEEDGAPLSELLPQKGDGCEEAAVRQVLLDGLLASLPPLQQRLLYLRYFKELSQARTGELLSLSQVQVSRLEKKALLALREKADCVYAES